MAGAMLDGVLALNLLVLRCADIDQTAAFYRCFGLEFDRHAHGSGPVHLGHEDERGVLELYPVPDGGDPDTGGLGFAHTDLAALRDQLLGIGLQPAEITDNPWGRTFVVRDPDGRRVEVTAAT